MRLARGLLVVYNASSIMKQSFIYDADAFIVCVG